MTSIHIPKRMIQFDQFLVGDGIIVYLDIHFRVLGSLGTVPSNLKARHCLGAVSTISAQGFLIDLSV